ncbi:MAG TPA: oligosaccharide flippase family protein [Puia sp.]|jgi:O-antigen/teichoic acid export membrane protein|nr:oligosaccharide flippase family protein [Puia sp.]
MKKTSTLVLNHIFWRGLYFFSVLLLNICIARFFAAEKSGQIFFIVNNLALVLLIASLSLESGSTYYIASGDLASSQMAAFCLIWSAAAALIAFTVWMSVLYYSNTSFLTGTGFLLASFLFILGVLLTTFFTALFYSEKKFAVPNKVLFFVNLFLILLLIIGKKHPFVKSHFVQIYFFGFFLQGLLIMLAFFVNDPTSGRLLLPSKPLLKKVFQYSLAALTANLIYFLVNRIDYWFVQYYCSAKDLGNYIQASKLAQMLFILPGILGATLFPIFSASKKSGNTAELTAVIRILFWSNGVICFLILSVGWYIIPLAFGASFNNMYLLFILLIPGILCVTMNYPMTSWFSANKRIGINIRGSLLALGIICIGDIIALPRYGVRAASIVSSAGFFSYYCYTIYIYRKEYSVSWKDFLLIRKSDLKQIRQSVGKDIQEPSPENYIV